MARFELAPDEQPLLQQIIRTTHDPRVLRRAQGLLWLAHGEAVRQVAARACVSHQTVYNWRTQWQARTHEPVLQRLADRPRLGKPATTGAAARQQIQTVIDQPPRTYGYDVPLWTTPLLQHYLRASGVVVRTRTIRRILRALRYRYTRPRYRLIRRSPTWRQAKGGSNAG